MAISAQFLTPSPSISTNFKQLQFPFNNSAAMLGKRPTTQLVELFQNQLAKSLRRYWQSCETREIFLTCGLECARRLGGTNLVHCEAPTYRRQWKAHLRGQFRRWGRWRSMCVHCRERSEWPGDGPMLVSARAP